MIQSVWESVAAPPVNRKEILRYAGCKEETEEIRVLVDECLREVAGGLKFLICHAKFPVKIDGTPIDFSAFTVNSAQLAKNLRGCDEAFIFACTVGPEIDRLIKKYSRLSPAKGVILQAIGVERVEELCDFFCNREEAALPSGFRLKPRFSPGYGDLSLDVQKDIFACLDCGKINLSLNESLMMVPFKSVTAICGIEKI